MVKSSDFKAIMPKGMVHSASADHVQAGLPIPKVARVQIFSPGDWEGFTEEWASSLTGYAIVRRFAGSGDMGLDVAGFTNAAGFSAPWDNYQCKRYDHPLRPADIHVEIGKIIYYSWQGEYTVPRRHFFAASKDIGTTAAKLLLDPNKLRESVKQAWEKQCRHHITTTADVALTDDFLSYFDAFDFAIFSSKSVLELIAQHGSTKYHAIRFGGGLPPRSAPHTPPAEPAAHESRYPPLSERLKSMFDGHPLAEDSWFWTFAACILIALLRQQHVRLDFTAPTARAFVGELFNALG